MMREMATMEIDRGSVHTGDSVRWTTRRSTTGHGLVQYVTQSAVHVETEQPGDSSRRRYAVPWERVTGHWAGREAYDRARGALTDHAGQDTTLRDLLTEALSRYSPESRGENVKELAGHPGLLDFSTAEIRRELEAMQRAGLVNGRLVRGVYRYVPGGGGRDERNYCV